MSTDNQEQLKKLGRIFSSDKVVTVEDISEVLKGVLGIMNNFKKENQTLTAETKQSVNDLLSKVIEQRNELVSDASHNKAKEEFNEKIEEVNEFLKEIKKIKATPGKDGEDGLPADEEKIIDEVLKKIELPKYKETILDGREEIVEKINSGTKKDKKIQTSQLEGFEKIEADIKTRALSILDQRTQFLINKTVKHDSTLSGAGTDASPLSVVGGAGSGTVTSVSVVTANGLSGTVATATTTPAITLDISALDATKIADGSVTSAEFQYLGGVTSDIQTQINSKQATLPASSTVGQVLRVTGASTYGWGALDLTDGDAITGALPVSNGGTGIISFATGIATWLGSGTASDLRSLTVGTTGSGSLVFGTAPTFATSITGSYLTASEILITDASKNIVSAPVATYPSLTELTYVKGVTSAIQTQIDAKQATITFGTGVLTALGVNVGSAGAFVTFNGALGTPSSGTVTNLTGTASININGTVGATTAAAGTFTTVIGNSFVPNASTVPSNGLYLPAANTLGWAINSAAELQLTGTALSPAADGGSSLGTTALGWQNIFGNTGFVLNIENSDWVATHTAGILTVGTGDLRVTTAGTNTASVVTVGGTQTLTGKTLTSPTLTTPSAFTTGGTITLSENTSIALDPAGSADGKYSGITIAGTLGATVAFGELVYLKTSDSQWYLADADALATAGNVMLGMCVVAGNDNDATVILLQGNIRADAKFPALTVGVAAYVGETAGAIQVAIPTGADNVIRVVGFALTADELYFCPSQDHQTTVA